MNRQKQERARQNIFRTIAFGLMFLLLATSIAGIASILFQNSPLDETGSGENNVELANTLVSNPSSSNTYTLTTKQDLQNWASNSGYWASGKTTVLAADIDWGGSDGGNYPRVTGFAGTFDGQNYVVKNLYMSYSGTNNVGFISTTTGTATIKNFGLINCNITGGTYTAGIVGYVNTGPFKMSDCFNVAGSVSGGSSYGYIAGLLGGCSTSQSTTLVVLERSFNTSTIMGREWCSGIIGYGGSGFTIKNSFNAGIVSGTQGAAGFQGNHGSTSYDKLFYDCYNTGNISGGNGTTTSAAAGFFPYIGAKDVVRAYNAGVVKNTDNSGGNGCWGSGPTSPTAVFNNSSKTSRANGSSATPTNLSTAQMTSNSTLTSGSMTGLVSGDGSGKWYKRTNSGGDSYYPELVDFAGTDGTGNDSWGRLKYWVAEISKWSVTAEQNTSAPAFTVGVSVSYTQPSEAQTTLPEYEGDGNTESLVINQAFLQASVPSGMTILWSDAQLKGTNPSTYIDMSTTSNSITLKSKFSDADRTFTLEFTLTPGNTGGIQALPTVVSLTIKVPKTPNIITII